MVKDDVAACDVARDKRGTVDDDLISTLNQALDLLSTGRGLFCSRQVSKIGITNQLLRVDPRDRRPEVSHNIFMKILKEEENSKYKIRSMDN
jgi:hypothetical protein